MVPRILLSTNTLVVTKSTRARIDWLPVPNMKLENGLDVLALEHNYDHHHRKKLLDTLAAPRQTLRCEQLGGIQGVAVQLMLEPQHLTITQEAADALTSASTVEQQKTLTQAAAGALVVGSDAKQQQMVVVGRGVELETVSKMSQQELALVQEDLNNLDKQYVELINRRTFVKSKEAIDEDADEDDKDDHEYTSECAWPSGYSDEVGF
eukprot:20895-Heterococcus_DN1.PRE.2